MKNSIFYIYIKTNPVIITATLITYGKLKSISTEHDHNLITNYSMCALSSVAPIANSS